jgi:hypothetical protein
MHRCWTPPDGGGPAPAGPQDLGEVYELVYEFIRKGGKLPVYGRWMKGKGGT